MIYKSNRKRRLLVFVCGLILFASVAGFAQNQLKPATKILLIPLDDRPPCLQFPVRMGLIGDAEIVTPPKEILGKFTVAGQSDRIVEWIGKQNLKSFDAAIVALDMVAYGGLVAMRRHGDTTAEIARRRVEVFREMKRRAPTLPIYAQSVIMRLAPTGDGANENYRERLARWAEVSPYPESKTETAKLESEIPAAVLADYKLARARDLQINLEAVEFVRSGSIDYLILSQDDAKPKGIHVADRERLIGEIERLNLKGKIAVQPGADETAMLLLARALNNLHEFSPKIKAVYSSEAAANKTMPFEDRALRETVSFHIKATGAREVADETDADLIFFVYASRFEPGRAASFAEEIYQTAKTWKKYIVADIDPKGDVQGADPKFTDQLIARELFFNYSPAGYASWNTAGNTIGTALPQGVLFALSKDKLLKASVERAKELKKVGAAKVSSDGLSASSRIARAQLWFTTHRLLDDYIYHTLVRADAKKFAAENKLNTLRFDDAGTRKVETFIRERMRFYMKEKMPTRVGTSVGCCFGGDNLSVVCANVEDFTIFLPWNRTFEAEIDFTYRQCASKT